jgi:hypothetical protein
MQYSDKWHKQATPQNLLKNNIKMYSIFLCSQINFKSKTIKNPINKHISLTNIWIENILNLYFN